MPLYAATYAYFVVLSKSAKCARRVVRYALSIACEPGPGEGLSAALGTSPAAICRPFARTPSCPRLLAVRQWPCNAITSDS